MNATVLKQLEENGFPLEDYSLLAADTEYVEATHLLCDINLKRLRVGFY